MDPLAPPFAPFSSARAGKSRIRLPDGPWPAEGIKPSFFVLCANDDRIRENIRYRIFDFCFDIAYDPLPSPLIGHYIRMWDTQPHKLFKRDFWESTMKYRPWSHQPRGLALFGVSRELGQEARYRFFWFHFPNYVIQTTDLNVLRDRLEKVPHLHKASVNAIFRVKWSKLNSEDYNLNLQRAGLLEKRVPWMDFTCDSGQRQRIITTETFQILEEVDHLGKSESLCVVGKLGNLEYRYPKPFLKLKFDDESYWKMRELFKLFLERKNYRVDRVLGYFSRTFSPTGPGTNHQQAIPSQRAVETERCERRPSGSFSQPEDDWKPNLPRTPSKKSSRGLLRTHPTSHQGTKLPHGSPTETHGDFSTLEPMSEEAPDFDRKDSKACAPDKLGDNDTSLPGLGAQLHGGGIRARNDSTRLDVVTTITKLLQNFRAGSHCPDVEDELRVIKVKRKTFTSKPAVTERASDLQDMGSSFTRLNNEILISEVEEEEHEPQKGVEQEKEVDDHARPRQRQHQLTYEILPEDTIRPFRPSKDRAYLSQALSQCNDIRSTPATVLQPSQSRETSFEYRISQWMKRERDTDGPRPTSSSSWVDGKEARELSCRKRVSSSSYHTCLLGSLYQRHSSNGSTHSATPSRLSAERNAAENSLAPEVRAASTAGANTSAESKPRGHQALSETTSPTTPNPDSGLQGTASSTQAAPLSENTNAATAGSQLRTNLLPASRRVSSTSSNMTSLCVGGKNNVEDDVGDVVGEEVPNFPGARQFLTPKKDVKPWWEMGEVEAASKSTGARKKRDGRKERERGQRGSTSSWVTVD